MPRVQHLGFLRPRAVSYLTQKVFVRVLLHQNLVWDPNSGEGLEAIGKEVIAQPAEVVERLKKILGE